MPDARELPGDPFAAHSAWLLGLARRLALDEGAAEDLVQQAHLSWLARGSEAVRDVRAFLGGIVRVLAQRERTARRAREQREARAAQEEALPSAAMLAERLELARILAEELARLPEAQRTLLLLHHQEGVALATIARRSGQPAGTVRAQITRARAELRARLDRRFADRREAWAALALALPGREAGGLERLAPIAATITKGMLMSLSLKAVAGIVALVAAGWWLLRTEERTGAPGRTEVSGAAAGAELGLAPAGDLAPALRTAAERAPAEGSAPAASAASPRELLVRLVDARDRAPLPSYGIEVRAAESEEQGEIVLSDGRGELRLDLALHPPPLEVLAVDDPEDGLSTEQLRRIGATDLPAEGAVLELAFVSGPTYTLVFADPPPPGAELGFTLAQGLEPLEGRGQGRLRPGPLPWVRFDPEWSSPSSLGPGPWTLTVNDRDGLWLAWGEVRQIEGVQAEPVVLRGEARGALVLDVTIDGREIRTPVFTSVYRLENGEPVESSGRHLGIYPPGQPHYAGNTLELLEPGTYRVFARTQDQRAERAEVEVHGGERAHVAFDLAGQAELAPLDVVLRSQTGRTRGLSGVTLTARGPDGGDGWRSARWLKSESDGLTYRFDALAPGEWLVELESSPLQPPWDRTSATARPGGAALPFVCLDENAPQDASRRVRLLDAATRAPLAFAGVTAFFEHRPLLSSTTDASGERLVGSYPVERDIVLAVRASGHRPALVTVRMEAAETEPLELALEPGWGALFTVVTREGPLAGVEIRLDGVGAATTDEHGWALVSVAARPAHVEFVRAGYALESATGIDPKTGAPGAELYPCWILMRRTP